MSARSWGVSSPVRDAQYSAGMGGDAAADEGEGDDEDDDEGAGDVEGDDEGDSSSRRGRLKSGSMSSCAARGTRAGARAAACCGRPQYMCDLGR
jgi:hypothetical protein